MWDQVVEAIRSEFVDLGDAAGATRVVFRLLMAALLGGVLGYERESKGKSAGLRTHMLVAVGAALFLLVPQQMGASDADLSRVIQGLVAGIGFLGAGAIVKGKPGDEIEGLTTAASIWMTAAIGMAAGLGREATAILSAFLALAVLTVVYHGVGWLHGHEKPPHSSTSRGGDEKGEKNETD